MSGAIWRSGFIWLFGVLVLCACRVPTDGTSVTCDAARCRAGTHCIETDEVASCEPDVEVFCGGFAGLLCPGGGICEDAPGDGCSVQNGGADCGGVCRCLQNALCIQGFEFDSSPEVCACVPPVTESPCALVDCRPGARCEVHGDEGICVSDGSLGCGEHTCPNGQVCCNDSCGICTQVNEACIDLGCQR
jgi:hypothetical protein